MMNHADELDRLIDALNAGNPAPPIGADDPELAGLVDAVLRVRQLRAAATPDADWPERALGELARELRSAAQPAEPDAVAQESRWGRGETPSGQPPNAPQAISSAQPQRPTRTRELAKMAAAIAVLVIVGGVLALVYHSMSGSNQPTIAVGTTPTAYTGERLPLTVTVNCVGLQLQSVDSSGTATRFSFMLLLGPIQPPPHQPFGAVLGSDPTGNITIDGITPGPNDPYETESDGTGAGQPVISFTLDYQAPFPTDKTVTLTIQHLMVPVSSATPGATPIANSKQVNGPWVFKITPAMVANQPMPTPFTTVDRFAGFSAASAQKWTSFPIVAPTPLPTVLSQGQQQQINQFNVISFALGVPATAPANYVMFTYQPPFGAAVYLVETTNDAGVPNISGNKAITLMPLQPDKPQTIEISPNTLTTSNINGVTVTRFQELATDTSSNTIYYVWTAGGVSHALWQVVRPLPPGMKGVSDADLLQMVTSIISQRANGKPATATVAARIAVPTPSADGGYYNLSFDEAEALTSMTLIKPTDIPPAFDANRLTIMIPPVPPVGSPNGTPTGANLSYPATGNAGWNVDIEEASLSLPLTGAGVTTGAASTTIKIDNTEVTRVSTLNKIKQDVATYSWTQGPLTIFVTATIGAPASEQQIEQLIASMIRQPVNG